MSTRQTSVIKQGDQRFVVTNSDCNSPITLLAGLRKKGISRIYPRRSVLFAEGQPPTGVHILCQGRAKISIASPEGKTLVLGIARAGDMLGMTATLTGEPYLATVETLERSRFDFVPREVVLRLLDRDKRSYLRVAHGLSQKLSQLVEQTRLLFLSQSASEKLARLLMIWCDENGKHLSKEIRIEPGLTHEEIAQMICSSRETVTRLLNQFRRENIISLDGDAIVIHNRKALAAAACYLLGECPPNLPRLGLEIYESL